MALQHADLAIATAEEITRLGLPVPDQLTEATIALYQGSAKGKYHWADARGGCKHVPGAGFCDPRQLPAPTTLAPVLGFPIPAASLCRHCADNVSISAPADHFLACAAEISRASHWLEEGHDAAGAGQWSWTQFARWRARQPLVGRDWDFLASQVKGPRWKDTGQHLRAAIDDVRTRTATVVGEVARTIIDDAVLEARAERAVLMVGAESDAVAESDHIAAVSTCPGVPRQDSLLFGQEGTRPADCYPRTQPAPWAIVGTLWRRSRKERRPLSTEWACRAVAEFYPHVHDLRALDCSPCCVTAAPGDCVHDWAQRIAEHHSRHIVDAWLERLELAWQGLNSAADDTDARTHLLLVDGWPLTTSERVSIAYLSQFETVFGPFKLSSVDMYGYATHRTVAVLLVPEWAAVHTCERFPHMRAEPRSAKATQAAALARMGGVSVTSEEFGARRKPSRQVTEARARRDRHTRGLDEDGLPAYLVGGYNNSYRYHRPMQPGMRPEPRYHGQPDYDWDPHSARWALSDRGTGFVYGYDQLEVLTLGFAGVSRYGREVRIEVELQTGCQRHPDYDAHLCELHGQLLGVDKAGAMTFQSHDMDAAVTIPAPYLVDVSVTR
jgi:hypothetical protein